MATLQMIDATQVCEAMLRANKAYNLEHEIWPSENVVIDRLLDRRLELEEAYAEIHDKLDAHDHGIDTMLGVLVNVTALCSPQRVADARDARNRIDDLNGMIADRAAELAALLEERSELDNTSGFASDTLFHIGDVMDVASTENGHYQYYLKGEIARLRSRFDLKYWPSLPDLLRVIGQDADAAGTNATNPLTKAATTGSRGSKADFFKALFALMEENGVAHHGHLPRGFSLSDETLASLANCALDLGPDDLVDGAYVKRLRQRERENRKADD